MLNFIEIRRLSEKLREIEGGRIGKIYYFDDHLEFVVHKEGKIILKFYPKKALFLSSRRMVQENPNPYNKFLREVLERRMIKRIYQIDNERAIRFELSDGNFIIFEIMPPGRLITRGFYIDRGKLVREVLEVNYQEQLGMISSFQEFKNIIIQSRKKDIVRALAIDLRLTGKFAEEILYRTKIEKTKKQSELNDEELEKLFEEYQNIIDKILKSEYTFVYEDTISLIELSYKKGERFEFWEGFEVFFERFSEKKEKKDRRIEEIEKKIEELRKEEEYYRRIGELLKENIYLLEEAIKERKDSVEIGGTKIKIDPRKSIWENISEYFEKAKKIKKKIEGAMQALEEIKRKLEKKKEEKAKYIEIRREKKEWYEKFRWFITSEGFLVVSGKDAITNDILIRKYMEEKDIVLHADIVGSPFTLIKNARGKCSEISIRQAAQFTLCYSRAWRENVIVPVYWVYPEQIGLSPPPGQYMKKGSFMIYGKKNYIEDLKLEIVIGIKDNKLMAGPREIFEKGFFVLIPGKKRKSEIAKKLKKKFEKRGYKVEIDGLMQLIPGESEIL